MKVIKTDDRISELKKQLADAQREEQQRKAEQEQAAKNLKEVKAALRREQRAHDQELQKIMHNMERLANTGAIDTQSLTLLDLNSMIQKLLNGADDRMRNTPLLTYFDTDKKIDNGNNGDNVYVDDQNDGWIRRVTM